MLSSGTTDTRCAVGVEGWFSGGVDIGWADARELVSRGSHVTPYSLRPSKRRARGGAGKDKRNEEKIQQTECVVLKSRETLNAGMFLRRTSAYTYICTRVTQSGP